MLEIPESHTIARQLEETVKGKIIREVAAGQSPHGFAFYNGDPAEYGSMLNGRAIDSSEAVAGYVQMHAGGARILLQDGANIRYLEPGEKPPKKHQLHIAFEDGSAIVCTISMYALLYAGIDGEFDSPYYRAAKDKPSPLSDAFHKSYFDGILAEAKPNLSAKALLATEQRIPGLGNGVLQDILFLAGVHPKKKLQELNDNKREELFHIVREVLSEMTVLGGRDTEKDLFGKPGGYKTILSKNTLAYPCRKCGGSITKQAYLGGAIYFCPACQPL